ncbi:MAG: hypothetical protein JWP88_1372 [Flaviaesturariibacter sp.]|nr:hypothetical protein [Flaviaesturariibacter sp.]
MCQPIDDLSVFTTYLKRKTSKIIVCNKEFGKCLPVLIPVPYVKRKIINMGIESAGLYPFGLWNCKKRLISMR